MTWEEFLEKNGGEQQVNMMLMVEMRQQVVLGLSLDSYYRHKKLAYTEEDLNEVCFQMNPKNPRVARQSMEKNGFGYALRESAERLCACKHLVAHANITEKEPSKQSGPLFVDTTKM
jgi:trigger factor